MERKNKCKFIELTCSACHKQFQKLLKEYKRRSKKDPSCKFYCSKNCRNECSQTDEYSPFRTFFFYAKKNARLKKINFDLDLIYIKELWETQNGKCVYSKVPMRLFPTTTKARGIPNAASLDRIDSSKGYVKGNVHFVCLSINYAKHTFEEIEFVNFLNIAARCLNGERMAVNHVTT